MASVHVLPSKVDAHGLVLELPAELLSRWCKLDAFTWQQGGYASFDASVRHTLGQLAPGFAATVHSSKPSAEVHKGVTESTVKLGPDDVRGEGEHRLCKPG